MKKNIDLSAIVPVVNKYLGRRDALIPLLQEIQDIYGYLPENALEYLSKFMSIPMSRVYAVVTFYSHFYLKRRGKNIVRICRGTACHVRGGKNVQKAIENRLGIGDGQTTPDFKYTLETVACLGACALGPVVLVGEQYFGKMTTSKVLSLLETVK
jgi:NADH-quinone oxidoreductase subunit E